MEPKTERHSDRPRRERERERERESSSKGSIDGKNEVKLG